ncbi:hypothetical protein [uncultured Nocardioides sp.]|uniref:hypothetical protein n=1 Tax=Nocardioides sp. T5 TaxID=3400182 RepID=UPI0026236645|nr:hypothetical protein [uncultured Nocardioides sp.]
MRRTTATALISALTVGAALAVPAQAAAPTVELQPQRLARGADIAVPHIEDGVFVDGERRIELPGTEARIIGASSGGWMVGTHRTNAVGERRGGRVVHVMPDGTVRTVLRGVDPAVVQVTEDGSSLLGVPDTGRSRATVKVWAVVDGTEVASRTFGGWPEVVASSGAKVLVRTTTRTFWWNFGRDEVRRPLTRRLTGTASIEHDLLVTYTKDPYLGGCMQLVRLSRPNVKVWRSCRDRVAAISPDGTEMLTFHILTDGLGPGEIRLREVDGTRLATYSTNWFGSWGWESPGTLLLNVNGKRKSATVRCTLDACENATDPVKVRTP